MKYTNNLKIGLATEKTCLRSKSANDVITDRVTNAYYNSATCLLMPDDHVFWSGLTNIELREYADDPYWVKARVFCFGAATLVFVGLLAGVVATVVMAPVCQGLSWWQRGPVYHIVAQSYMDGDGSGRGDLSGIESKLDYIADLGVKIVWISPIYKSPMKDFGYDIQDFKDIDETFGNLQDFMSLVKGMKQRDLKLVMDFVPNHSSDQHVWFQKSIAKQEPYTDYYVWAPAKSFIDGKPLPPNNWVSFFGGSAWEWSEQRKEFYLHQFAKEQPDLNFRKQVVVAEMVSVLKFWLELGVDGFRVDAAPTLFEDALLRDEPASGDTNAAPDEYSSLSHIHTFNLPEVMDVMDLFRNTLDEHAVATDKVRRLLMAEVYDNITNTVKYYGVEDKPVADFPFNFLFITELKRNSTAVEVKKTVEMWMDNMPRNKWPNWVLGNHDQKRVASRFGEESVDSLNMMLLLLPGTAVTYYGEEIGMEDTPISWEQTKDPCGLNAGPDKYHKFSRDPARTPMQWNAEQNAGFSSSPTTWLPLNSNFRSVNVDVQKQGESHLNVYKALVKARNEPSIMSGVLDMKAINDSVFAFTRIHHGSTGYVVAVNWAETSQTVNLREFQRIPSKAQVYTHSINSQLEDLKHVDTCCVLLGPKEGVVLMFTPESIQHKTNIASS